MTHVDNKFEDTSGDNGPYPRIGGKDDTVGSFKSENQARQVLS